MSTSNPFDKLNVKREEEDDEQGEFHQVKGKDKNVPYGIEQKKKKIRPKEVEKEQEGGDEGFEEVPSKTKKRRPVNEEEQEESKTHKKRRGVNYNTQEEKEHRLQDKPRRGRQYDRQSGTGRGREIAKGGAGGKGTWGDNPKNIAKNYENYNDDDYYFETALNPEKKKERPPRRPKKEDEKETEEKEGEENKEENKEDKKERKEYKPRPIEIKEEDKLKRPENEISLEDYLKSKEKPKEEEENKEVERIKDGKPLTKNEKKKEEVLGTTGLGKKKEKKKKEKKVNQEELDLNMQIGDNLEFAAGNERRKGGKERGRGRRGGRGGGKYFHYKDEDFPEFE